jgi:hypothetical protein
MKTLKKIFLIILFLTFCNSYSQKILIFGGQNHDVFLGCLNCSKYDDNSIWNKYGDFGSKYNDKCIWNKYGDYSGKYSDISPFNKYGSYPPVLVDKDGNFYGYFTANSYKDKATDVKLALFIIENWETISEDVGGYYEKIFN